MANLNTEFPFSGITHTFDVKVAETYGIEEALLIYHLKYWITFNKLQGKNFKNGRTWMYQSQNNMLTHLSYFRNRNKLMRVIESLIEQNVIVKDFLGDPLKTGVSWYAFAEEERWIPGIKSRPEFAYNDDISEPAPNQKSGGFESAPGGVFENEQGLFENEQGVFENEQQRNTNKSDTEKHVVVVVNAHAREGLSDEKPQKPTISYDELSRVIEDHYLHSQGRLKYPVRWPKQLGSKPCIFTALNAAGWKISIHEAEYAIKAFQRAGELSSPISYFSSVVEKFRNKPPRGAPAGKPCEEPKKQTEQKPFDKNKPKQHNVHVFDASSQEEIERCKINHEKLKKELEERKRKFKEREMYG